MGADTRGKRELGEGVLDGAELVADVRPRRPWSASWRTCPAGRIRPGASRSGSCWPAAAARLARAPGGRRIVFDSVGTAVVDAAAVAMVLAAAERAGVGALVDFAS